MTHRRLHQGNQQFFGHSKISPQQELPVGNKTAQRSQFQKQFMYQRLLKSRLMHIVNISDKTFKWKIKYIIEIKLKVKTPIKDII